MNGVPPPPWKEVARRPWPIVVVGAGPAGAMLAREAARCGREVLLVDRTVFPRPKVCGCCLNAASIRTLDAVGLGNLPGRLGAVPLTTLRLTAGRSTVQLPLPAGAAVSRENLDLALVREAEAAGATFLPATAARLLPGEEPEARRLRLSQRGDEVLVSTRVLVVADGLGGLTLVDEPIHRVRIGATSWIGAGAAVLHPPPFFEPGTVYMACGEGGYVGLVRLEDGRLDLAAALDPLQVRRRGGPAAAVSHVLSGTGWPRPALDSAQWKGTPRLTRRAESPAGRRFFLVGDAAGYVEPFTGEGIAWALASAVALGPLVIEAVREWRPSQVGAWRRELRSLLGQHQLACRLLTRLLHWPALASTLVATLQVVPAIARPVMAYLNRPLMGTRRSRPHGLN